MDQMNLQANPEEQKVQGGNSVPGQQTFSVMQVAKKTVIVDLQSKKQTWDSLNLP